MRRKPMILITALAGLVLALGGWADHKPGHTEGGGGPGGGKGGGGKKESIPVNVTFSDRTGDAIVSDCALVFGDCPYVDGIDASATINSSDTLNFRPENDRTVSITVPDRSDLSGAYDGTNRFDGLASDLPLNDPRRQFVQFPFTIDNDQYFVRFTDAEGPDAELAVVECTGGTTAEDGTWTCDQWTVSGDKAVILTMPIKTRGRSELTQVGFFTMPFEATVDRQ